MQNTQEYKQSEFEMLSLMIAYNDFIDRTILKKEYFEDARLKQVFEIICDEYCKAKTLILSKLAEYENFDYKLYAELLDGNLHNSDREIAFKELERKIIEDYKQRQYKQITLSFNGNCEETYQELTKINDINYNENEYINAKDIYETLSQRKEQIKLGYPYIDQALNLSQNDLMILAGGTGTGKTAFALNLLNNLSKDYQCIYFNMEMSKNILYKRLIGITTGITLPELNNFNDLTNENKIKSKNAMLELQNRKIILVNKSLTINQIKKYISTIKTDKHTIIFLDHIGLIKSKGNSLYERMTEIAKELRSISIDNDCTIIGLCQLSRDAQKNDTIPKLQDLRDSGEIEQSARKVIMIHNKSKNKTDRVQDMEIIIAKNDDGNKIIKEFEFDRYTQIFTEPFK